MDLLSAFSCHRLAVGLAVLLLPSLAPAAPDPADAARVFAEAEVICRRDGGNLWGQSLCGPILLVDYTDRSVVANVADAQGKLIASGKVFTGTLPESVIIANTPTEWSGVRWTQLLWPLPTEEAKRHVLLSHELFHRIQPALKLTRDEVGNQHLDTLEGRYLLQLEWRALAQALKAPTPAERRAAVSDAQLFRHERYRLFPQASVEEGHLEINEGVPEYTGVRLGLTDPQARIAFAEYDLSAFVQAPTFVRSFAYATGPAYGLLLDEHDPAWRGKLGAGQRLDQLLSLAMQLPAPDFAALKTRAARYDDGTLRSSEESRDSQKRKHLAELKTRLVDGPVLIVPLKKTNRQFNPQTLQPLGELGMVYPTLRLTGEWGALQVESGGALLTQTQATVSTDGVNPSATEGDGWRLDLKPGWSVRPGDRAGDLIVVQTPSQ
ncbi:MULTISPECIES: hypothetical protein [unclassified Lysobacter]|uniref:hypothetical protein n=1 Tax=unclassified Lysobacter TaxID=2635362 RepID=UPI0009EAEE4F|nr:MULTISPECIES: hypothetical protein [unclassified Lysobacter]